MRPNQKKLTMKKTNVFSVCIACMVCLFATISCKKTVLKEVEVPGPVVQIGIVKDPNYQNQTATPGNGMLLGMFTIFNNQQSGNAIITGGTITIRTAAGNSYSNLSVYTDSSSVFISHPREVTTFSLNAVVAQQSSTRLYFNISTDVADTGTIQAVVKLNVSWGNRKDSLGPIEGQITRLELPKLDTIFYAKWGSSASQFVASRNSAVDATELVYQMQTSTGGGLRISELQFAVVGTQTASSIRVGGVSVPFINGVARFGNLNVWTWNDLRAIVSYPSVGSASLPSGTTSQVILTHLTYSDGVRNVSIQPNISGNTMKLVGSKPTVEVFQPNVSLTTGLVRAIDVTVAADSQGDIVLNKLPIQVWGNMFNSIILGSGSGIVVRDDNNQLITTLATAFNTSGISKIFFQNGYRIPAGSTAKFRIFVPISYAGPNASINTSIVASDDFVWTDVAGNASVSYVGTDYIQNYPGYFTSVVHN